MLRRYSAKLLYELKLHAVSEGTPAAGLSSLATVYARTLGDALRVAHPEAHYLTDVDPGFYAAAYLRAWALAAQMARTLAERHGRRWYASRQAGSWLRELWSTGQRYTAEELAREIGHPGLSLDPLADDLRLQLGGL